MSLIFKIAGVLCFLAYMIIRRGKKLSIVFFALIILFLLELEIGLFPIGAFHL